MLTTLLTLFGGSLGGILRFVPEVFKLFTEHKDREHEYRMTELQLKIDEARSAQALDLVHAQGAIDQAAGEMKAYLAALEGQGRITGVGWIDALNQSVRPVLLYWWMILFTAVKVLTVVQATGEYTTLAAFISVIWTPQDAGILSMMIGFWYVNRTIEKRK